MAGHPEQGWSLPCNGVIVFDDLGEILPGGQVSPPHRPAHVRLPEQAAYRGWRSDSDGDPSDASKLEPNWIPAPAGPFLAGLRMYGPSGKVQNDQWHMPALEKAD